MTTKDLQVRKEKLLNKETKTRIKIQSATGQPKTVAPISCKYER